MRNPHRLCSTLLLVLLAFGGSLLYRPAAAAPSCGALPPSWLIVYAVRAPAPEMMTVSAAELERSGPRSGLASHHTLMVSTSDLVSWFDIMHRIVPGEDGSVCDAPSLVRIGFGTRTRHVVLARPAAADTCARQTLFDHEATHNRAIEEAVDQFIDRHQYDFQRGVSALKQTAAPDAETAKLRWEQGLRIMAIEAKELLLVEVGSALAAVDTPPAIAALEDACGGKIRRLMQMSP